jgi:adenosylcobinamide-GDP ribazoletransferase
MKGLKSATSFLTRVHVRGAANDLAKGVPWFPVVGALLGLTLAGIYAVARLGLPSLLAAAITVAFGVWVTGAIHEDGLADTADAFGGVRSREETLRILSDPRLGAYGVGALALSLLVRVAALGALGGRTALAVLPAAHALSRAAAVRLLAGPIATDEGLGSSYVSATSPVHITVALVVGGVVGAVALGPVVVPAAVAVLLASWILRRVALRRIGGVTGDVMGAVQQASEILILLIAVAAARRGALDVPWF